MHITLQMKKISLIILFLAPLFIFSQPLLYNGGATICVQPGALLHVQGSVTNDANSTYQNDGILELNGNFTNNGNAVFHYNSAVSSTDRVVKFTGTGKQRIIGNINTTDTQSLYNIVVNQQTASDTVEMQADVLVQGSLVFGSSVTTTTYNPSAAWTANSSKGLLKTFASNSNPAQRYLLSIKNGNVDAIAGYPSLTISGSPTTGFVLTQGRRGDTLSRFTGLQRRISSTAAYVYPVGTIAHSYNALRVHFTTLTGGAGQDVVAQFSDSTSNTNGYVGNLTQYCNGCTGGYSPDNTGFNYYFPTNSCYSNNPEWIIMEQTTKKHGYWSMNSTTSGSTYQYWVEAFPNSFVSNRSPLGAWRLLKYSTPGTPLNEYYNDPTNSDWTSQILSSVNSANDLLTYTMYTSCYSGSGVPGGLYTGFSQFGLFGENTNNSLPVNLLSLTATPINNQYIKVSWATATEINNAGFMVMRSTDGTNFENIGWVAGNGNSTITENYYFNDNTVMPNVEYYYQLNQKDLNGNITPSNVVSAMLNTGGNFAISNFMPNPTKDASKLIISTSTAQRINIKFFDLLGREVSNGNYNLTGGENSLNFDIQNMSDATYAAVITTANGVYSKKLVVAKN